MNNQYGIIIKKEELDIDPKCYIKKVFDDLNDAVKYVNEYTKEYIVRKCGIEFYDTHSKKYKYAYEISDNFKNSNTKEGYYLIKNKDFYQVYNAHRVSIEGYVYNCFNNVVELDFEVYINKVGTIGYTPLKSNICFNDVIAEMNNKCNN
jgi:hypothetical protein